MSEHQLLFFYSPEGVEYKPKTMSIYLLTCLFLNINVGKTSVVPNFIAVCTEIKI